MLYEDKRHAKKGHVTKTAIFFKNPTWRTATILKIIKSPYLSEKNVRFWWNLVHHCRYRTRWQERDQKLKFLKFNMAAAAMLKIAFLAITHRPIFRFWANFVRGSRTACRQRPHDKNQKLQIFKYQHGRRPPFWKSLNRHFSVKKRPILMKFGTLLQISNPMWPKIKIFKIQDSGRPPF